MELTTKEFRNYFRLGELGTVRISDDSDYLHEFPAIIVQLFDSSLEVVLVSDELPGEMLGREVVAQLSVITGHLVCDVPVIIGKNSFEQTLFLRFNGEAVVRIKRNFIRTDVLIPFCYDEHGRNSVKAVREVQELRAIPSRTVFAPVPYSESYKIADWPGKGELLPVRVNLGGGGIRFASVEPFQRGTMLGLQMFLDWPEPRVIHAALQVTRSKPFEQTPEDRAFYTWSKIRLKSQTISITAGQYDYIDDGDRQFVIDYIKEIQKRQHNPAETEGAEPT
ncbi:hypothetical protein [Trichlorobacter ammonificans]|uniref:PilZ domain-containing protein n=1 Tax=Trichlorobacter ammonificans TaxID=2916410 RepID=A0ABN8HN00_9BACT|nr:hypothetical protein [Trichlorobacter ammonificans]CAH2032427.1 conserved protein of unknown function [Trichlorobacter ammonificans]